MFLQLSQSVYLHNLLSSVVTLSQLATVTSLKVTDCSFRCASLCLCNHFPDSFHPPCQSCLNSPGHARVSYVCCHHHSQHHSFTSGSKPTISTSPSHYNGLLVPHGPPSWISVLRTGQKLSCS